MTIYLSVHTVHITALQCDTIPDCQKIFDVNVQLYGALGHSVLRQRKKGTGIQQQSWNDTCVRLQRLLMKEKVLKQSEQLAKQAGVGIQVSNMMWCHST